MSLIKTGETYETQGEVSVEWQIPDFFPLPMKVNNFYESPDFCLSDSCYYLRMYPNGQRENKSAGMVGLYIYRVDSGPPKTLSYTIRIKGFDENRLTGNKIFIKGSRRGLARFTLQSILYSHKSELMTSNALTVTCNLKSDARHATKASLFSRLWNISRNLKAILEENGKMADYTLKSKGREWPVHKVILESRCEYFAGMFRHDWKENTVGEVKLDDFDDCVLKCILCFIYTGEVDELSVQNVCNVYVRAHELLLNDLKMLCIEYMTESMCVELVCGALVIAEKYGERELKKRAMEYFSLKADEVVVRDEWKQFKKENVTLVAELLENIIVEKVKKDKTQN